MNCTKRTRFTSSKKTKIAPEPANSCVLSGFICSKVRVQVGRREVRPPCSHVLFSWWLLFNLKGDQHSSSSQNNKPDCSFTRRDHTFCFWWNGDFACSNFENKNKTNIYQRYKDRLLGWTIAACIAHARYFSSLSTLAYMLPQVCRGHLGWLLKFKHPCWWHEVAQR